MLDNPIEQFIEWYKDAKKCASIKHPEAMTLSTINNGCPEWAHQPQISPEACFA